MTIDELKAIKARRAAITGGDWGYSINTETKQPATLFLECDDEEIDIADFEVWDAAGYDAEMVGNAEFIVHAPVDIDNCIKEIERLQKALEGK